MEEKMPRSGACYYGSRTSKLILVFHYDRCFNVRLQEVLDRLSTLGFSSTYEEASRLEGSYVLQSKKAVVDKSVHSFSQFIFDNADFSVNTLDGKGTFHAMGGIMSVTPRDAVTSETDLVRMEVASSADLISMCRCKTSSLSKWLDNNH